MTSRTINSRAHGKHVGHACEGHLRGVLHHVAASLKCTVAERCRSSFQSNPTRFFWTNAGKFAQSSSWPIGITRAILIRSSIARGLSTAEAWAARQEARRGLGFISSSLYRSIRDTRWLEGTGP